MCTALGIKNIITKSKYILMKFIRVLECSFHGNAFRFPFKINDIMKHFRIFIQILYKTTDSIFLMIYDMFDFLATAVLINDRKFRIQICRLMHTAFDLILFESRLFKNFRIWKKVYFGSGLFCLANLRKQSILQFHNRNASLIAVVMNIPLSADLHIHINRQCIDNGRTYSVKPSTRLICGIIKLTAGV